MPVFYGSNVADGVLTTACDMATASGGAETTVNSAFTNNLNHYAEAWSQGGTNIGSFASIPATPTGQGWVYAPGIGAFDAGNWSAQVAFNDSLGPSPIDDITLRFFRNSGSSYTLLGSIVVTSPTLQTTRTDITFASVFLASATFAAGEKVYVDVWYHNTVASGGAGNITDISPSVYVGTSATAGVTSDMQVTAPNWVGDTVDPFIITLYGSNVVDAALTNARDMSTAVGGTEVLSTAMTWTTTNAFGEIVSAGGSTASAAAIPATPTGRGWVYAPGPGPGTFALGNWSASVAFSDSSGPSTPTDITLRVFKYSSGVYTSIGSIVLVGPTINTTRTILTFAGTSMPAFTFAAGEWIYVDLWYHTANVTLDHPAVYVSTSATAGVASDVQVTTAIFTPLVPTTSAPGLRPRWVMRPIMGGIFTPFQAVPAWVERALTAPFVRPTQPTTIARYVRRSLTSLLLNYGLNIQTRFWQMSAAQQRDNATRLLLSGIASATKDAAARLRLQALKVSDLATRTRLIAVASKNTALRLLLLSQHLQDVAARIRLIASTGKDTASRLLLLATVLKNTALRLFVAGTRGVDQSVRLRVQENLHYFPRAFGGDYSLDPFSTIPRAFGSTILFLVESFLDAPSRLRLLAARLSDQAARVRLLIGVNKDLSSRLLLLAVRLVDVASRLKLLATGSKDSATRTRLFVTRILDAASRLLLRAVRQADQAGRLRLLVVALKDQTARIRLLAQRLQDNATRTRLRAVQQANLATRTRLLAMQLRDLSSRLRLATPPRLDQAARLRLLVVTAANNLSTRLDLLAVRLRDQALRLRLRATSSRDQAGRLLLQVVGQVIKDQMTRLRLLALRLRDQAGRMRLSAARTPDQSTRTRLLALGLPNASLRVRLYSVRLLDVSLRLILLASSKRELAARLILTLGQAVRQRDVGYRLCIYDVAFTSTLPTRSGLTTILSRDGASRIPSR